MAKEERKSAEGRREEILGIARMSRGEISEEVERLRHGAHPDSWIGALYGVCRKLLDGEDAHVCNLPTRPLHAQGDTASRLYNIAVVLTNDRWGQGWREVFARSEVAERRGEVSDAQEKKEEAG